MSCQGHNYAVVLRVAMDLEVVEYEPGLASALWQYMFI